MPLDDNEVWLHPIKVISVKWNKPGVPRPEGAYDSSHEPLNEDELHDYQARFGLLGDPQDDLGQSSTHPPPPPPPPTSEAAPSSPTPDLEDPVLTLTDRFDAFWDETQEHRVLITQDMEALRTDVRTVLANQATILQQQQSLQAQLAQLLALHQPPPPPPVVTRSITKGAPFTLLCSFIASGDTGYFLLGRGGGGGGGGW